MPIMYYGSRISDNMVKTPEGYLICRNVPIGRTGAMQYLAEEFGIEDKRGQIISVYRKPEELFSKATMASFEGKPVTNNHPSHNLGLDTVANYMRGHMQNIRQDGELLMADLFVTDAGLIAEIDSGKREVSCGYDCLWVPQQDGSYEQQEIVGNHVAVVQNGRAGPHVAIQDEQSVKKDDERSKKKVAKAKITNGFLAAIGLKKFAEDAEPEDLAEALRVMGHDSAEAPPMDATAKLLSELSEKLTAMDAKMQALDAKIDAMDAEKDEEKEKEGADAEFEALEKETKDAEKEDDKSEVVDADDVEEKETKDEDDTEDEEDKKSASDSAVSAIIKQMKPIIMAIPDKGARDAAAKAFAKSVRDSRAVNVNNGYGNIQKAAFANKKAAADEAAAKRRTLGDNNQAAVNAWNKHNANYVEGGK